MAQLHVRRRWSFFDDRGRHYLSVNGKKRPEILLPERDNVFEVDDGACVVQVRTLVPLKSNPVTLSVAEGDEIYLSYRLNKGAIIGLIVLFTAVAVLPFVVNSSDRMVLLPLAGVCLIALLVLSFTVFATMYTLKIEDSPGVAA
ncbi:hypothetical protein DDD64_07880 [Actinotignum sanguinis]|uniref:hypothetical protein n=1 Tax=Actinotignum sanguinis TaxID=1445614 RepID=UPI000F7E2DCD|nr:hypothetical protein [Actinotignum sanguinis]MDY5148320.1 hypothetical protein [Actinotignum sanguinis]RTE47881.1 hypothetical protein DDD64_07880 [Actinotignum sanguinis]